MSKDMLDIPLLALSPVDHATFRDFAQNIFVTGVTGGGKTTGPGHTLLKTLLLTGAGGIVLCAKPGEAQEVIALCKKLGRSRSVMHWHGSNYAFNFLAYALCRLGPDGINGIVEYLMRVVEMMRAASALPAGNGDAFWLDELRIMLRYSVLVVFLAQGTLRIADLLKFANSAPTSPEQMADPAWQATNPFFLTCFALAAPKLDDATGAQIVAYWRDTFARHDPKLRSNILAGFSMLDRFNHGWLRDTFCGDTTIVPALCFHGAIIIVDMPRATLGEDGVLGEMLIKDGFQTDVLGRNALAPAQRERYVFLYGDECQEIATERDVNYLAMSRSSRATTIYLTQSLPSMYFKLGGQNAHDRAHALIGNFGIRIFCANHCTETNEWAAKTLGRTLHRRDSGSDSFGTNTSWGNSMNEGHNWGTSSQSGGGYSSDGKGGGSSNSNWSSGSSSGSNAGIGVNRGGGTSATQTQGWSEQMDWLMEPGAFATLKTGGPRNGKRISAVWAQAGKIFAASNTSALMVEFQQS